MPVAISDGYATGILYQRERGGEAGCGSPRCLYREAGY
jgi:hypothetical protein